MADAPNDPGDTSPTRHLSVFDRLLDDAPDRPADISVSARERLKRAKEAVRRDLEVLFNTQTMLDAADSPHAEIAFSLVRYGVPGFHGLDLATPERRRALARTLQDIVRMHEPRLHRAQVEIGDERRQSDRMLHLRVRGELVFEDAGEPVAFDTVLDPAVRQFRIDAVRE